MRGLAAWRLGLEERWRVRAAKVWPSQVAVRFTSNFVTSASFPLPLPSHSQTRTDSFINNAHDFQAVDVGTTNYHYGGGLRGLVRLAPSRNTPILTLTPAHTHPHTHTRTHTGWSLLSLCAWPTARCCLRSCLRCRQRRSPGALPRSSPCLRRTSRDATRPNRSSPAWSA